MEEFINNEGTPKIQLRGDLELYVNIRDYTEQEIDIFLGVQSQSENNRSITIELTNFKDKNDKEIRAKLINTGKENYEDSKSYKLTIDKTEVIKMQFSPEDYTKNYDFNEINFDIVSDNDIYSFIWNYPKKNLTKYIKNKKETE